MKHFVDYKYQVLSVIFFVGLMLSVISLVILSTQTDNLSVENKLFKTILIADRNSGDAVILENKASDYYSESSYAYMNNEWTDVERNCRIARGYYQDASQKYREIRAELLASQVKDKLIDTYVAMLDIEAELDLNMYEACEHFESASRYYARYYSYTNSSLVDYEMGTKEINSMNDDISEHDKNVRDYNDLVEEFKIEIGGRLE